MTSVYATNVTNVGHHFSNIGMALSFSNIGKCTYNTLPTLVCGIKKLMIAQASCTKIPFFTNIGISNFFLSVDRIL